MLRKLPMCFLAMSMAQAIQLQNGESEFEQIFQKSLSRPACTSVEGSCKTDTAAAPNLDVRTVFNLPAGSQVNDVDGGPPGPHGPPYPIAINAQVSSRPACTSEEGSCKTGTAADPAIDTRTVFNLPAGSVVNNVDGGPPGPTSPFPININAQISSSSRPACTSEEGSCKTGTAADPAIDTRTVFNLPAGSVVNNVDGGPPGPTSPFPININAQISSSSRPACTSEEGSCKTGTAADPAIDTRHVFNLPAGSVVNDVDGGPPGPTSPLPININLQLDAESRPACTSFECKTGTAAFQFDNEKAGKHPMDYFVPNFGEDKEMIAQAQHLKEAEAKYGKWDLKESKEIKRDYTVPNFGVDHDVADSLASETSTSAQLGINWTPTQDANGVWLVPQPIDNKSYSYKV